jgi:chemotaxis protein CheC
MLANPHTLDLDALREVASIGCGRAVTALGRLSSRRADMTVPEVRVPGAADDLARLIAPLGASTLAVGVELEGFLGGHLALVLPEHDARRLAALLGQPAPIGGWDTLSESAILEAGNIAGSAFVSAVGRLTGATLLLSVPRLARGCGPACIAALFGEVSGRVALATRFHLRAGERDRAGVSGLILAVPDPARIPDLLAALPGVA